MKMPYVEKLPSDSENPKFWSFAIFFCVANTENRKIFNFSEKREKKTKPPKKRNVREFPETCGNFGETCGNFPKRAGICPKRAGICPNVREFAPNVREFQGPAEKEDF